MCAKTPWTPLKRKDDGELAAGVHVVSFGLHNETTLNVLIYNHQPGVLKSGGKLTVIYVGYNNIIRDSIDLPMLLPYEQYLAAFTKTLSTHDQDYNAMLILWPDNDPNNMGLNKMYKATRKELTLLNESAAYALYLLPEANVTVAKVKPAAP